MLRDSLLVLVFSILVLSSSACSRHFSATESNSLTAKLPSSLVGEAEAQVLDRSNAIAYSEKAYLKINNHSTVPSEEYQHYLEDAVKRLHFFKQLHATLPTVHVNVEPRYSQQLAGNKEWYEQRDHYSIKQLRERYPNEEVLILEATLREQSPYDNALLRVGKDLSFEIKAIDLQSGKTLFHARKQGRSWLGVDRSLVDPVMSKLSLWLQQASMARGW